MAHYQLIMDRPVDAIELRAILTQHFEVSSDAATLIAPMFSIEVAEKNSTIVKQGERSNQELLLLSGSVSSSIGDVDGATHCVGMFEGPCVLPPHISRTKDDVSRVSIETISPRRIAAAPASVFMELMVANETVRDWGNTIMRKQMLTQSEHQWALAALNNAGRLKWFRRSHTNFEDKFEHWRIASFLGMTPVSFSRARKQFPTKKTDGI
ncbi:hypothetical protein [Maritalea sp.]|uniref:hypothetical protein n=1 Tax=Maritalea sp. TaxID=2003361 RepID=UPI003EF9C99A